MFQRNTSAVLLPHIAAALHTFSHSLVCHCLMNINSLYFPVIFVDRAKDLVPHEQECPKVAILPQKCSCLKHQLNFGLPSLKLAAKCLLV